MRPSARKNRRWSDAYAAERLALGRKRLAKRRRLAPMSSLIAKIRKWLGIGKKP
jgi:hypothetical protein